MESPPVCGPLMARFLYASKIQGPEKPGADRQAHYEAGPQQSPVDKGPFLCRLWRGGKGGIEHSAQEGHQWKRPPVGTWDKAPIIYAYHFSKRKNRPFNGIARVNIPMWIGGQCGPSVKGAGVYKVRSF